MMNLDFTDEELGIEPEVVEPNPEIEIIDCEQGSEDWLRARMGIPTASEFSAIMAVGRGDEPSLTRRTYLYKLAGEILTGEIADGFSTKHTKRGHELEPVARNHYAFLNDVEPLQVGFIRNGRKGCSPDSLIDINGGLEIKTKLPHLQIEVLKSDMVPHEHEAQVQGSLYVCEREWWDFMSYCPKLPPFIKRVYRDEDYIDRLAKKIEQFNEELDELVEFLRNYEDQEF